MADRSTIVGAVLAGGQSRRMGGQDKALMPLAGRPLIGHVIDRLTPQVDRLGINANGDPERFSPFGVPVFADTISGHAGPLAGILAAMGFAIQLDARFTHVATAATDTPFFPTDMVARLADAAATSETIAMATSGGNRHPVFGLWPVSLAGDLEAWLRRTDTFKVLAWAGRHNLAEVDFAFDDHDPFFNVNTPRDREMAESLLTTEAAR